MKRQPNPQISSSGELVLAAYEQTLLEQEDLYIQGTKHDLQQAVETIART